MYSEEAKKEFLNLVKPSKGVKISIIISIILLIAFIGYFVYLNIKPLEEPKYAIDTYESDEYAYFNVNFLTDCFATYEDGSYIEKYYMAGDEKYIMILKLNDTLFNEMSNINKYTYGDIDEKPESIRTTGMTKEIPSKLKELALDFYNKMYPDNKQTITTISNYIGGYYLDTTKTPNSQTTSLLIALIIFDSLYLIIIGIVIISNKISSKKEIGKLIEKNELDNVYGQYLDPTKEEYSKQNIIFLKSYIIDYSSSLKILKYTDIIWFYMHIHRVNGVASQKDIIVLKNDKKRLNICGKNTLGKYTNTFEEIINKLAEKCPNALIGYTNENIAKTNRSNIDNTIKEIADKNLLINN